MSDQHNTNTIKIHIEIMNVAIALVVMLTSESQIHEYYLMMNAVTLMV